MGEAQEWLFEPTFNRAVKVCASDDRITSDAGLILLREADHRLGLTEWLAQQLADPRRQDLIRYQLVELLRERVAVPYPCLCRSRPSHFLARGPCQSEYETA